MTSGFRKGDIVRVSRELLSWHGLKPGRKHAGFYALRPMTEEEVDEFYLTTEPYACFTPPPINAVEYLNTDDHYIVMRARVKRQERGYTDRWCEVINLRDGKTLFMKNNTLEKL